MQDELKESEKNTSHKEIFEKDSRDIHDVILSVQESYNCLRYLRSPDANLAVDKAKKNEVFFALCTESFAYSIYINLHKLFSDGENKSFFKFIKKITTDTEDYKALNIPPEVVKRWRAEINKQRKLIDMVGGIRNDGIAHFKKTDLEEPVRYLTFQETEQLIKIAQDIFKDIYNYAFEMSYLIDKPVNSTPDSLKRIVEYVAKYPHLRAEYQKLLLKNEGHDVEGL